ncbi:ribonuclease E inhibitor RraB [Nocardioides aurantiacus]|uniref:ribonuclease E inhibitor RraB n=1 Tax=Nocardioides aurantiacus TaxID=86796 RepID=UPI000F4844EF
MRSPRAVDHAATFRSKSDAASAAARLSELGFDVTARKRLFGSALEFCHVVPTDPQSAAAFTRAVVEVVEQHRGTYDGGGDSSSRRSRWRGAMHRERGRAAGATGSEASR